MKAVSPASANMTDTVAFLGLKLQPRSIPQMNELVEQGIRCKAIVSGCLHGKRIIVNDFAASNPYPSCEAVVIKRNELLEHYLP